MKGYQSGASHLPNGAGELSDENAEAVGELIAFGAKGHGQFGPFVFTRFVHDRERINLSMSKGVSQLLKDLEEWRVVQHRVEGNGPWSLANTNRRKFCLVSKTRVDGLREGDFGLKGCGKLSVL